MYPELFKLGPLTIYSYGVLLAASYLLGLRLAMSRARKWGLDANRVLDLGIYIIIAALVGAKLLLLIVDYDQFSTSPADLLSLARSGGVFYGGLILAVAVAFWYIAGTGCPSGPRATCLRPVSRSVMSPAGWAVSPRAAVTARPPRCRGRWSSPIPPPPPTWARRWASPCTHSALRGGAELLILGVLLWAERRGRGFPGRTFWAYMFLYTVSRFVIEFYRGDPRGTVFGVLSTSQFISVVLAPLSLVMLAWLARLKPTAPQEARSRRKAA